MARVTSNELVASAQAVQREVVDGMGKRPHIAVVRVFNPKEQERYRPTASYAAQIRSHAGRIGAESSEYVVTPDSRRTPAEVVRMLGEKGVTGIMPLYPLPDTRAVKDELDQAPHLDIDDLLELRKRAPTARAMIAMGNLSLHGPNYFRGRSLDDLSQLQLPADLSASNIRFGGEGQLTGRPLRRILADQGVDIRDDQIATASTPHRLADLPMRALVFTATPTAEQIRDEDIQPGSVIIDAGFGIIDGEIRGNTDHRTADRDDVLWTPPREGVGPVSTTYLFHHLLEAGGVPIEEIPRLGDVALFSTVELETSSEFVYV